MNFAENLRALREKNGMTQEQLAERMEVSRQTVSKWEAGGSFPEMEKMLLLTEIFDCTMDGLMKGNMQLENRNEAKLYEAHGRRVARLGTMATCICILSLAAQVLGEYINPDFLGESGLPFLLGALLGTAIWVRLGMESSHFRKKHPYIEPFFSEEEKEAFHQKYMGSMVWGIGTLIGGVIVTAALSTLLDKTRMELLTGFLFLIMVAVGVSVIVHAALLASMYNVEGYNADNAWDMSEEGKENGRRIGTACGVIMLIAVLCCVALTMTHFSKVFAAIPLVVGGILCGVAALLLNRRKD